MPKSSSHERHQAYPVYLVVNKSSQHSVLSINDSITATSFAISYAHRHLDYQIMIIWHSNSLFHMQSIFSLLTISFVIECYVIDASLYIIKSSIDSLPQCWKPPVD